MAIAEDFDRRDELLKPMTLASFRSLSENDLVRRFDALTTGPASEQVEQFGPQEYLAELNRRDNNRIARQMLWMTLVITLLTLVNVVVLLIDVF